MRIRGSPPGMLRRIWHWFVPKPKWRIMRHDDGLWYVEVEHRDHGWVHDNPGFANLLQAARYGRDNYGE